MNVPYPHNAEAITQCQHRHTKGGFAGRDAEDESQNEKAAPNLQHDLYGLGLHGALRPHTPGTFTEGPQIR